jgi:KilA-N domain
MGKLISGKGGTSVALIPRQIGHITVNQRADDGYVEVTPACKAAGKQFSDYSRLESTSSLLEIESRKTGISPNKLVISQKGRYGGTWVHPRIAINLGQWLSPEYASAIIDIVEEWKAEKSRTPAVQPVGQPSGGYIRRSAENEKNVPPGYFCVMQLVADLVVRPMECLGYVLPPGVCPDISVGLTLARHLRETGTDTDDIIYYPHLGPNGYRAPARAYPNRMLPQVRRWVNDVWLVEYAPKYFARKKDPKALEMTMRMIDQRQIKQIAA